MADEVSHREQEEAWARGEGSYPDRKMQRFSPYFWREAGPFDWTGCSEVEVVVGKLSGVPVLMGTRFSADNLLSLYEGGMDAQEIVEEYDLDLGQVEHVLGFALGKDAGFRAA